jgi:hypothetical protein
MQNNVSGHRLKAQTCYIISVTRLKSRYQFDQALRPWEVQPARKRFVLEGAYLYHEEQAESRPVLRSRFWAG